MFALFGILFLIFCILFAGFAFAVNASDRNLRKEGSPAVWLWMILLAAGVLFSGLFAL